MKTIALGMLLCVCGFAFGGGAATAPTSQPAARASETIAQMRARLAQLEHEEAELREKIAKESLALEPESPYIVLLNTMPKNIWPSETNHRLKWELRQKWMSDHIKKGTVFTFSGKVDSASEATVRGEYKNGVYVIPPHKDMIAVVLDGGDRNLWGGMHTLHVQAVIENATPEEAANWVSGKMITVSGPFISTDMAGDGNQEVSLGLSKMKGEK